MLTALFGWTVRSLKVKLFLPGRPLGNPPLFAASNSQTGDGDYLFRYFITWPFQQPVFSQPWWSCQSLDSIEAQQPKIEAEWRFVQRRIYPTCWRYAGRRRAAAVISKRKNQVVLSAPFHSGPILFEVRRTDTNQGNMTYQFTTDTITFW